ncbi:MAG TPA: iron uptake transporter permease EfeU [Anaerolineales bacterium]|nr:iron uptake transporter permease EfeU [Anaerolineales bacterium]
MIAAALITFREGLEAALIVGILVGYIQRTGRAQHMRPLWLGVAIAVAASAGLAVAIRSVGLELEGRAEAAFEGLTMFTAAGLLTWMIFWMRYQARNVKSSLERDVEKAIRRGQRWGLASVAFIAVFREGVEMALFATAAAFAARGAPILIGVLLGLLSACVVGYLVYSSTARLNLKSFFNVTSALLLLFAAGLVAHGVHEFQEAVLLPTFVEHVWDTSAVLDESSILGQLMKALIGYNAAPSLLEVVSYGAYWAFAIFGVRRWIDQRLAGEALRSNLIAS